MKNFIFLLSLTIIPFGIVAGLNAEPHSKERAFYIEERISLKEIPKDANSLRIWIPYPTSDKWQRITDISVSDESGSAEKILHSFNTDIITDKIYGNKILYLKPKNGTLDKDMRKIVLSFKALRWEHALGDDPSSSYEDLTPFLKANNRVPVNDEVKMLALRITDGKKDDIEKVRAIYDYIIDELTYSRDDPKVCGIGDTFVTLQHRKGICTDYHSLFISLVRSLGIPAKFEIGFPIYTDKEEDRIKSYHCWAKFYLEDKGWIPVDISEADKHPEKRDYFFGNIDENRVHLTTGRDINLEYAKDMEPLNFFVYPYIEFDGMEFVDPEVELSFKDLRGGG